MLNRSLIPPFILLTASAIALAVAYISQYFFGLEPCHLCLYQRIPYAVVIVLAILALPLARFRRCLVALAALAIVINIGIAGYHVGVESHVFEGLSSCSGDEVMPKDASLDDLRNQLLGKEAVRCDKPAFVFLSLSMAGWNVVYMIGVLVVTGFAYVHAKRH